MRVMQSGVGTPLWAAPEVLQMLPQTEKVDVYSYALVLYELFTGDLPFAASEIADLKLAVVRNRQRPPIDSIQRVPVFWKQLMKQCWEHEPEKRPDMLTVVQQITLQPILSLRTTTL